MERNRRGGELGGLYPEVHPGGDGREAGGIFSYSALSLAFFKKRKRNIPIYTCKHISISI